MTESRSPREPLLGDLLDGRYRLEAQVGEGGMATVYRAIDESLGRTVAIKLFQRGAADSSDGARRETEKKLLASLSHPALVTLYDAQLTDHERAYLVMEYVEGGTLTSRIETGSVSAPDAALLAADLGEALHVVHAAGIVHRDIKPSNILLRPPLTSAHTFRAVLADFGIAYLLDTTRVTTPGIAVGTAAYISPEQVRGAEPTPASDIYALGLVLIEALTGRRAFPQPSPHEAIAVRLSSPPVVPSQFGYGWKSLLAAMTALDPIARPSALEVAATARGLDTVAVEPDVTAMLLPEVSGGRPPISSDEATKLLPAQSTAATEQFSRGATATSQMDAAVSASASPPMAPGAASQTSRRTRRLWMIGGVAAAGLAAIVIAFSAWGGLAPAAPSDAPIVEQSSTPTPAPTTSAPGEPSGSPVVDPATDTPDTGNDNSGPGNSNGKDKEKGKKP